MNDGPTKRLGEADAQRGFTTLEIALALAITTSLLLATAATFGLRPPRAHAAAIELEAALVEARSLAAATADGTDAARATGATVYVAPDPSRAGQSTITVYRSRPIPTLATGGGGGPLAVDVGFPPQHVAASLAVSSGGAPSEGPFAILVSSSGYASVVAPLAWDPGTSDAVLPSDPGCLDDGVAIASDDGSRHESHPLACRNASYDASH